MYLSRRRHNCLAHRLNGNTLLQKLRAGEDHLIAWVQAFQDWIRITDDLAQSDRDLVRSVLAVFLGGNEDKGLATHACYGENRHHWRGVRVPRYARLHHLRG